MGSDEGKETTFARRFLCDPTCWVITAVLIGGALGIIFQANGWATPAVVQVLGFPGKLWLKGLKCIVLPMIVFSMVESMVMLKSLPGAKFMGIAIVGLHTLTTLMAAIEGCAVSALVLGPMLGNVTEFKEETAGMDKPDLADFTTLESILNIFDGLVPKNLVGDTGKGYLLPVIVASIVFGLLIKDKNLDGTPSATIVVIGEMNEVVVKVVTFLMNLTAIGVGSLVFTAGTRLDMGSTGRIVLVLVLAVILGLAIHFFVVYACLIAFLARRNPIRYMFNLLPALVTALGTSSSAATLPVTTQCCIEKNDVAPHIAKFVLSLGATINMDGTGLYLICAAFFLGTLEGVEFTFGKFATMAILAMLCSLGTAPVPSASLVLLATIMSTVGIPLTSSFGLITAVDWLLDRMRTVVNVAGDASVTSVADRFFGEGKAVDEEDDDEDSDSA